MRIIVGLLCGMVALYAIYLWCLVRVGSRPAPPPDPIDNPYRFQREKEGENDSQ
jgi:hypothetical protein